MIEVWVSCVKADGLPDEDWGAHTFSALPRSGEEVVVWVDGEMSRAVVDQVFHSSRPKNGAGPTGDPNVVIRVSR